MDLQHSLHLLATCKNYQSLSSSKAFWLVALNRMTDVHRRPLPCPSATDLSTIALDKLREMAIRAYTLMRNWSAENPTPVSARTFQMPPDHTELRLIPGTHLMVVVWENVFFCWDVIAGTSLGSITFPTSRYIIISSTPFELPGQCFLGVAYHVGRHIELAVICIDYGDSANVTIAKTHSYEWAIPDSPYFCLDVALDGNQIGMIIVDDTNAMPLALVYCNHHDKMIHCINTQRLRIYDSPPCCLIHAGQFYIASQDELMVDISHVRTNSSFSQATQSLPPSIRRMAEAVHSNRPQFRYELRSPRYDVFAVTHGSLLPDMDPSPLMGSPIDHVYFWPAIDTGAELNLGPTCSYEHDCWITDMCVSSSGRSAVIWSDHVPPYSVGLIQYVAFPTPHTTFRLLDIPPDVARLRGGFARLDDSLGVLYL
ncbi:hypothetical protein C8J57DRAFT_1277328, partial [Mycena rebaudengoi]